MPNTIAELNDWSNQALSYTDDRPYSITFSANAASNQSVSIVEDQSFIVPSGIDIVNAVSLPGNITYTIDTANVGNAIVSWPPLPQGVSSAEPSTGVYQITGVFDGVTWSELKQAVIVFKDLAANATFTSNIAYPNTANVALSNTWSWTTNVAVTASSDELSTPTGFSFDEDTPLVIPGPPLIIDAYSGNLPYSITVTPNTTDAVLTMVSTGLANSSFNLGPRQLTITGTKLEVNNNLGNITLTPGVDWDENFSLTYSLTNPVSNLVTQVTQAANIGNVDTDFSFTSSYNFAEDAQTQLVFAVDDSDTTITELKMVVTPTLGGTGTMFVNGINAGIGNTAILSVANETAFNTANITYVPYPDDTNSVQLTANVYKTNITGNVTVATNQVMTLTCNSTHDDYSFPTSGTYDENTFLNLSVPVTDLDPLATDYYISWQQTSGNIGQWFVGNTFFANSNTLLTLNGTKTSVNAANIKFFPMLDNIGNVGITYNQTKTNSLFGNVAQASNVVGNFSVGNTYNTIDNMTVRTYTTQTFNNIFSTSTPVINDGPDYGQTYSIGLSSPIGRFGNSAANAIASASYSFTGSRSQVNSQLASMVFAPNVGNPGNSTFTYTQSRDGISQVNTTLTLTANVAPSTSTVYTWKWEDVGDAGTTWTPTFNEWYYGNTEVFMVGAGGSGITWQGPDFTDRWAAGPAGGQVTTFYGTRGLANELGSGTWSVFPGRVAGQEQYPDQGGTGNSSVLTNGTNTFTAAGGAGAKWVAEGTTNWRAGSSGNGNLGGLGNPVTLTSPTRVLNYGGGGGGAGGEGQNANVTMPFPTTGNGGAGISSSITGTTIVYGGGQAGYTSNSQPDAPRVGAGGTEESGSGTGYYSGSITIKIVT